MTRGRRGATAVAKTNCTVIPIKRKTFPFYGRGNPFLCADRNAHNDGALALHGYVQAVKWNKATQKRPKTAFGQTVAGFPQSTRQPQCLGLAGRLSRPESVRRDQLGRRNRLRR